MYWYRSFNQRTPAKEYGKVITKSLNFYCETFYFVPHVALICQYSSDQRMLFQFLYRGYR